MLGGAYRDGNGGVPLRTCQGVWESAVSTKTLATGVFRVRHSRFIGTNTFCSSQTLQQWSAGDPDDGELRRSTTFLTAIEIEIRNVRTEC